MDKKIKAAIAALVIFQLAFDFVALAVLTNKKAHGIYHAAFADQGHRGFHVGDFEHRKAVKDILAMGGLGTMGRFRADTTDQLLMEDGQTVLNIMDRVKEPLLPGHFISVPVSPRNLDSAKHWAAQRLRVLGDEVSLTDVPVKTPKGDFMFAVIHSSKLDFLIVLRPPTSVLGEPPWEPLDLRER